MSKELSQQEFDRRKEELFHQDHGRIVNRRAADLPRLAQPAVHHNPNEQGDRAGHGINHATWIFSEVEGQKEGIWQAPLELAIDMRLEANAAIGLHEHPETEEFYYLIEGQLTMHTRTPDGQEVPFEMHPGDTHLVRLGQSHWGKAGPEGCRALVVAVRAKESGPDKRLM